MARLVQSILRLGDIVEVQTFSGALQLASVRRGPEADSEEARISVTFADGRWGDVPLFTLRWHLAGAQSPVDLLQREANAVLQQRRADLRQAVFEHDTHDPLSRHRLLYEGDLVRRIFGAGASPAEQYAVHLWLWSESDTVGRDAAYSLCPEQGAGPYFIRQAKCLPKEINGAGKPTSNTSALFRAAVSDWNDTIGNPYIRQASEAAVSAGHVPIETRGDAAVTLNQLSPGTLDSIDLPRERSGLDFASAMDEESGNVSESADELHAKTELHEYFVADVDNHGRETAFAIDAAHTVEVDDAISLSRDARGRRVLHVHVADAARVAPRYSEAFSQALERVSSLYCADATFRMLPMDVAARASIGEGHDNEVVTFSAVLSGAGDIEESHVAIGRAPAVKRLTPDQVDDILAAKTAAVPPNVGSLNEIQRLAQRHLQHRLGCGAYSLHVPRMRVHRDASTGELSLHAEANTAARAMVAECMIIGGRVAARWAMENGISVPFRAHESHPDFVSPDNGSSLAQILHAASMLQPSRLVPSAMPHAALGLAAYTRATSPLRRAPDLVLHSQIRARLLKQTGRLYSPGAMAALLPGLDTHEQYLRRLSLSSNRFWTMRYMEQQLSRTGAPLQSTAHLVKRTSRGATVFLEAFGLSVYGADVPRATMEGATFPAEIPFVDAFRQVVDVRQSDA